MDVFDLDQMSSTFDLLKSEDDLLKNAMNDDDLRQMEQEEWGMGKSIYELGQSSDLNFLNLEMPPQTYGFSSLDSSSTATSNVVSPTLPNSSNKSNIYRDGFDGMDFGFESLSNPLQPENAPIYPAPSSLFSGLDASNNSPDVGQKPKRKYKKRKSTDLGTTSKSKSGTASDTKNSKISNNQLQEKKALTIQKRHSSEHSTSVVPCADQKSLVIRKYNSVPGQPTSLKRNLPNNTRVNVPNLNMMNETANTNNTPRNSNSSSKKDENTLRLKQTSSFRGVSCCGKDRKWQARIRDANKVRYLGRFSTEVEAALVYDEAARALKGEKAPTNFVVMEKSTAEELKKGFVDTGGAVPDHLKFLIARKGSSTTNKKSPSKINPIADTMGDKSHVSAFGFPESPLAKLHKSTPGISPAVNKSTFKGQKQKALSVQLHSRLHLDDLHSKSPYQQSQAPKVTALA